MSNFDKHDGQSSFKSAIIIPFGFVLSSEMELIEELLVNTGFVFETNKDHIVISGIPVNVTESEVSLVLEQLLSDLQDGIPRVALVKMIQ
jgi:DNA mismatch repair protein MutL